MPQLHKAFEEGKASLSCATLLAHHNPATPLALVTDASSPAMGALLQQLADNAWQPLIFFSKKLNATQQKYSAYDCELLAACEIVKYFRHMLESRHFALFTDHKPITFTFQQKLDRCSTR
jgi:cleavage and polyadenylation specificity factor subunit 1